MSRHATPALRPAAHRGRAASLLALVRWPNVLLSAAGVAIGAWWAVGHAWAAAPVAWAVGAAMLIAAFVNATNDLADVEIDRVAHPRRPLASGALDRRTARLVAAGAASGALAASALAGGLALVAVTAAVLAAAAAYSPRLKRHGSVGNVAVAIVASLPFVYGAHAAGHVRPGVALLLVAVPLHLARELAKDLDDADADAAGGRVTLPHRVGVAWTRRVIAGAVVAHLGCVMFLLVPGAARPVALLPGMLVAAVAARRAGAALRPGAPALFKLSMLLAMGGLLALR